MTNYKILDFVTKKSVTPHNFVFTGNDSPWELQMDMDAIQSRVNLEYFKTTPPALSKYLSFMPITKPSGFVSLSEYATPLVKSKSIGKHFGIDLYFKVEGKNPTGSFKDRGSAVDITVAKELGAKAISLASTGNMAASCSCYAAAANMPCFVFVPEGVPVAKLAQVIAFGGQIIQVKGTYNDAAKLAQSVAEKLGFFLAGDYAFRVEGQKTAAFEILDQLLFQVPHKVFVPMGCGTNITAYGKGFYEYRAMGLIDTIPQLMGVQATGAQSIVNSFERQSQFIETLDKIDTIATAIAVPRPLDGIKALAAIRDTQGKALSVTDMEILRAQYRLSTEEGLFVESASAASLAALLKYLEEEQVLPHEKIVCVLTGDGLKQPEVVLKAAIKPPTIYPDLDAFSKLYDNGFFNNKTMIFVDKDKVLFDTVPNVDEIKTQLEELYHSRYTDYAIKRIETMIISFLAKGKRVTLADFQDIIQDVRENPDSSKIEKKLSVLDFEVSTAKDRIPQARVTIQINQQSYQGESTGVGPVDAVIQAIRVAGQGKIAFTLDDYQVNIRTGGVNAVVSVEMKLSQDNIISIGRASSPDSIQASVEAFEAAYNGFI